MEQLVNTQPLIDMIRDTVRYGRDMYPALCKRAEWTVIPMFDFPSSTVIHHLARWLHEQGDDHLFVYDLEMSKGYRLDMRTNDMAQWYHDSGAFETIFFDSHMSWVLYNYYNDFFFVAAPPDVLALFSEGRSVNAMFVKYIHDVEATHEGEYKDHHLSICPPLAYYNAEAVEGEWVTI